MMPMPNRLVLFRILLTAALSFCTIAPKLARADSPVGHYTLRGLREVGSDLVLYENGRFEYMLAYGSYDEYAKGTWKRDGQRVILNSEGKDAPVKFTLKQTETRPEPGIFVLVNNKAGRGIASIDVMLQFDGNDVKTGYTQTYGFEYPLENNRLPRAIGLGLRRYNVEPQWTHITGNKGNVFVFELDPGDLGQAKFRDQVFLWDNQTLVTDRNGQRMRYVK
jgi:hypothetical protein